jgi:hypothetical protein
MKIISYQKAGKHLRELLPILRASRSSLGPFKRDRRLDRSRYTVLHNELHVRSAAEFIIIPRCDSRNNRARWAVESRGRKLPRQFHFEKVPAPATFSPPTDGDTSH